MQARLQCWIPFFVGTLGCGGQDHTFQKIVDPIPPLDVPASLRIDLAIQENEWGAKVSRCQMQVAFEPLPEFVDPDSSGEDASETPEPSDPMPQIDYPKEAGECVFSEIPAQGPPPDGSDPMAGDNWQLSGDVVGPTYLEMWKLSDSWTLDVVDTEHGGLRYEWLDCAREDYPFSATLTMDVPRSEDPDGVHPFTMEDLVPVGPRLLLDAPIGEHGGQPKVDIEEGLEIVWHTDGDLPVVEGEERKPETLVKIQTQDHAREEATRWLLCWPEEDGWLVLSPEDLAPLYEDREDPERYTTNLDVHMELLVSDRPTPWGEALTVRTNVSSGAGIEAGTEDTLRRDSSPP